MNFKIILLVVASALLAVILGFWTFGNKSYFAAKNNWQVKFEEAGTNSSPKAIDLNQDGILDVVIGAGGKEYEKTEYSVLALDGKSGEMLWKVAGRNQIVGSAVFEDINGDQIPDVFIGGRSAQFMAINGKNGEIIWEFLEWNDNLDLVNDTTLLNFFNPQFIPDQDNDGYNDLLISFGGFVNAKPEEHDRPSGYLMVFSLKTGEVLAKAATPDRKEIYYSPVCLPSKDGIQVVFGTGGETVNGGLYIIPLTKILAGDVSEAIKLADGEDKGFIAPSVLVDINGDTFLDIVSHSVNGRMLAFDGLSLKKIWEVRMGEGIETYSMPTPLDFNQDSIIDFFGSFGIGTWPNIKKAVQIVVDGKTGEIVFRDNVGTFQFASPVVYDITNDEREDVIYPINLIHEIPMVDTVLNSFKNLTVIYDFDNFEGLLKFKPAEMGTNLGATPLLTDLDQDGALDIIYCRNGNNSDFFGYSGLVIERIELSIPKKGKIPWGEYMGSESKSIFKRENQ